jgi:hypothetical protein
MNTAIKAALIVAAVAAGASSAMAAPARHHSDRLVAAHDPWVQPIHEDSAAVPAKQYFEEMQRDGE